jgi:hypothetical protein
MFAKGTKGNGTERLIDSIRPAQIALTLLLTCSTIPKGRHITKTPHASLWPVSRVSRYRS